MNELNSLIENAITGFPYSGMDFEVPNFPIGRLPLLVSELGLVDRGKYLSTWNMSMKLDYGIRSYMFERLPENGIDNRTALQILSRSSFVPHATTLEILSFGVKQKRAFSYLLSKGYRLVALGRDPFGGVFKQATVISRVAGRPTLDLVDLNSMVWGFDHLFYMRITQDRS